MGKKDNRFERYLRQLEDGAPLDAVLASVPERERDEVRALLSLAGAVRAVPHPVPTSEASLPSAAYTRERHGGRTRRMGGAGHLLPGLWARVSDAAVSASMIVTLGVVVMLPMLGPAAPPYSGGGPTGYGSPQAAAPAAAVEAEPPGEPDEPGPAATASAPSPAPESESAGEEPLPGLSFFPERLGGAPPYEAEFRLGVWEELRERIGECEGVTWDFGDAVERAPCPTFGPRQRYWTTTHTYAEPGTYYPRISVQLADGRVFSNFMPQTVVVAEPQAESSRAVALRLGLWGGAIAIAAAIGAWLWHRPGRTRLIGFVALGMLLAAAVPPFSYLPDPAGIVWRVAQRYSYDPRLPFVDRFLVADDPSDWLSLYLDAFIGKTGLDPLDPEHPLTGYEFLEITVRPESYAIVKTRMTYADGSQLTYDIWLAVSRTGPLGLYQVDWQYDGLQGLRLERSELNGIPFAADEADAPLRLDAPALWFETDAATFDEIQSPFEMVVSSNVAPFRLLSPDGNSLLMFRQTGEDREFWIVSADGGIQTFGGLGSFGGFTWLPDSTGFLYTTFDLPGSSESPISARVMAVSLETGEEKQIAELPIPDISGLNEEGLWYIDDGALWLAPFDGGPPLRLSDLSSAYIAPDSPWITPAVAPTPGGSAVAYACGSGVCIQDRDGSNRVYVPPGVERPESVSALVWNAAGSLLAATWRSTAYEAPAPPTVVAVLERDGTPVSETAILPGATPGGEIGKPQWVSGKDWLLLQAATQFSGRRIIAVDAERGAAYDLTQPLWDAWGWVTPDGDRVLLYNGRGNFWISDLEWNAP
jgi:hypothetical protein